MVSVVVFFKQKTAYEMRISDWSSDVCSSDLQPVGKAGLDDVLDDRVVNVALGNFRRVLRGQHHSVDFGRLAIDITEGNLRLGIGAQIGRASCRERVCQYV